MLHKESVYFDSDPILTYIWLESKLLNNRHQR